MLIVSLEDNADELRRRLCAACLHHLRDAGRAEVAGSIWPHQEPVGGKLVTLDLHGRPVLGGLARSCRARSPSARSISSASIPL